MIVKIWLKPDYLKCYFKFCTQIVSIHKCLVKFELYT